MTALPLFADPTTEGQRPPVGEYTDIQKPTEAPFLPELAARHVGQIGAEFAWHTITAIHADESNPFNSPYVGSRLRFNIPTVGRNGKKKWPAMKTDRVIVVTEAQEREAGERWEREHAACCRCGGDGLVFNGWHRDKGVKYATCDRCKGTGAPGGAA